MPHSMAKIQKETNKQKTENKAKQQQKNPKTSGSLFYKFLFQWTDNTKYDLKLQLATMGFF